MASRIWSVPGWVAITAPSQEFFWRSKGGGVQLASSRLLASWTPPPLERQKNSWEGAVIATQPGTLQMREAMYYALSLPLSTVIVGCDSIQQLEENVLLARQFTPLSAHQMTSLAARAEPVSKQAMFFKSLLSKTAVTLNTCGHL